MSLPFKVLYYRPEEKKPLSGAAIIVLQEWWGINDTIKNHAQRIANHTGALTAVPDIYKGKVGLSAEEASHLMDGLDWKVATSEIESLIKELRGDGYSNIGAIGFCMGGGLSLALAVHTAEIGQPIQAAVTCYGTAPDNFDVSRIEETAIQGHFGGKDELKGFSDPAAADKLEQTLLMKDRVIHRYPEQGHAFLNDDDWSICKRKELGFVDKDIDPLSAEQVVRDEAWQRIYAFFTHRLKKK